LNMRHQVLVGLTFTMTLTGCASLSVPGAFTAVGGPLSMQSPAPPAYRAKMTGVFSGTISVTLANGELCTGPWSFVPNSTQAGAGSPTGNAAPVDLSTAWDSVYGQGFYVAHVVGNKLRARATLACRTGTLMYVELSNETNTRGNTKGVSQDNHGNLFKVSVYN
jgi:hypothetical protein